MLPTSTIDRPMGSEHYEYRQRPPSRAFAVLFDAILLAGSCGAAACAPTALSQWFLSLCLGMIAGLLIVQFRLTAGTAPGGNCLSTDVLFGISYVIVHFLYVLYWCMSWAEDDQRIWYDESIVCYATAMCVSGLAAFLLGFNVLRPRRRPIQPAAPESPALLEKWSRVGTFLLALTSVLACAYVAIQGRSIWQGEYAGSGMGTMSARSLYILIQRGMGIAVVLIMLAAGSLHQRVRIRVPVAIAFGLYIIGLTLTGDRSSLSVIILLCAAAYAETHRPFRLRTVLLGILILTVVFGAIRIGRSSAQRSPLAFLHTITNADESLRVDSGLTNLGQSIRTVFAAVSIIPAEGPYFMGALKTTELAGIVPFSRSFMNLPDQSLWGSAYFLTDRLNKSYDSGTGTTIVADIYLDFGYPGVVTILLLLGLLARWAQQRALLSQTLVARTGHVLLLAGIVMIPRYHLLSLIRNVFWPWLAVALVHRHLAGRSTAPSQSPPHP